MVKATVEKLEDNKVMLEVEVEAEAFEREVHKAYKKLVGKYNIPGFRRGKAPKAILENYIGKGSLYEEALDAVLPQAYLEAVEEVKIEPVDQPDVDIKQMDEKKPLIFTAKVQVKPEVELGEYHGLEVEKVIAEVKEQDVEAYLDSMRQRYARLRTVEDEGAKEGDTVTIDFEGFLDGVPFEGGRGEKFPLELGSGSFIPGFEEQLVGVMQGEDREIKVTFPEDYQEESLQGKEATFRVKVHEVKRKELSPLDDEFAKDVSEFETLEELKAEIRNNLKQELEESTLNGLKDQLIKKAAEASTVEIPEVLVERQIDRMIDDLKNRLEGQGIPLEQYWELTNTSKAEMRESFKDDARRQVKAQLVLEAIAKKEGISATEEEIDQELERMAQAYQQDKELLKNLLQVQGNLEALKESITLDKTVQFLLDQAQVKEAVPGQETEGDESSEEKE